MIFYLYLWILIMSSFLALCSFNWFLLWLMLEVNMMTFIPIMNYKLMLNSNSMIKYYIIQVFASSLFLIAMMTNNFMEFSQMIISIIIMIAMLIKLGSAPFHIWFPQITEGLMWFSIMMLLTWQKIIPMYILSFNNMSNFLIIIILMSLMIGPLGGFTQISLRKILVYSSITHMGWMLSIILMMKNFWIYYLLLYSMMTIIIIIQLMKYNINFINQINLMNSSFLTKFSLLISLLSLGGLPPLLGFFPKLMVIYYMNMYPTMLFPLILSSLINLYFYLRILYPIFLKNMINKKNNKINNFISMISISINSTIIFFLIPYMIFL
uniref:NADH-ubiquinone oxidoreductase chain 2 n=1 Tax=Allothyrus sp. LamingtonNP-QMS95173 TaxID=1442165 RepID=W0FHQ6_9ACAR|nr:NADH dehydrogenase subunit 2 [Allothyrus sp. LamingtonNP-QMS95173]